MVIQSGLAEGTPIWLPGGTVASVEDVVERRLPILAYGKVWDTRPVRYGAGQGVRDMTVGQLLPTTPSEAVTWGVARYLVLSSCPDVRWR
jgi:hypothetical protein